MGNLKARLFFGFRFDAAFGVHVVEQTGCRFDQIAVVTIHKHRKTELPGEDHRFPLAVIQQDSGPVAPIVNLTALTLPLSLLSLKFKGVFLK
ncbi:hypothetical protein D3C79_959850 [compost metagenome]